MQQDKDKRLFKNHWEMKKLIESGLEIFDSTEETLPARFQLIFKGVLAGFVRSRTGHLRSKDVIYALQALIRYSAKPRTNPKTQDMMGRFFRLMTTNRSEEPGTPARDIEAEQLPMIMIRITGLPEERLDGLLGLGDGESNCRLYLSEVNDGVGIVVFNDDDAHEEFQSKFFKENPCISDLIWNYL